MEVRKQYCLSEVEFLRGMPSIGGGGGGENDGVGQIGSDIGNVPEK